MRFLFTIFIGVTLLGCSTSPLDPQTSSALDTTQLAAMGIAGAAGGFLGNELYSDDGIGAAIGTGVGILGAAITTDQINQAQNKAQLEAYEAGKRDARTEVMEQYWYDQTRSYQPEEQTREGGRGYRDIQYEAAVHDGVRRDTIYRPMPVSPYEPERGSPYLGSEDPISIAP